MLPPDLPAALPPEALRASFSGADFDFATTEALAPLEFGAAATLTNPLRAEIMARFKAA